MIPIDNFAARINSTTIRWLLESALLAHQNVIRIWGGGAYQTDEFYDVSQPPIFSSRRFLITHIYFVLPSILHVDVRRTGYYGLVRKRLRLRGLSPVA